MSTAGSGSLTVNRILYCMDGICLALCARKFTLVHNRVTSGRAEVLRSSRHYLQAQSQGHHTVDRVEERGVERGSTRRSSLKGREKVIQSDEHWNCFKGNAGGTS